jgi:hypothetical protein
MFRNILTNLMITALALILVGCSGGGNTPVNPDAISGLTDSEPAVYISENIAEGSTLPMIFGIYEVSLDALTMTGDIRPVRNLTALGDSVMVDVTPFLSITPCSNCMKIKSIGLGTDNTIEVTFQTKHPFEPGKRLDLHVFDPRGIIVTGYDTTLFSRMRIDLDGDGTYESPAEGNIDLVANADGYTSFYDAVVEDFTGYNVTGNICPFKNLWYNPASIGTETNYDPGADTDHGFTDLTAPRGHNVFPMGGTFEDSRSSTMYRFNLIETTSVNFLFVFEASYGVTTTRFTRQEPRYFLPEFHRKEALIAGVDVLNSSLVAYDSSPTNKAMVEISVVDWQAGITPAVNWDYATSPLTATRYKSDVKNIVIDLPSVLQNMIGLTLADRLSGDGTIDSPYIWNVQFTNELGAGPGKYWGLVAIRDDLEGSENAPLGVSSDVIHPVKMHDLTVYQPFCMSVIEGTNVPPIADVEAAPSPVYANENVTASVGPNCMDPDGSIVKYEYDFDYTPGNFEEAIGYTQADPMAPGFGADVFYSYDETQLGPHLIAQRVTDNVGATNIDYIEVIVISLANELPVADVEALPLTVFVNEPINVSVGGSYDPDGFINKYEYDFNYHVASGFVEDAPYTRNLGDVGFGLPLTYQYASDGSYDIALRVTDNDLATAIDIVRVTVNQEVINQNPVAVLSVNDSDLHVRVCSFFSVDPVGSYDPDGTLVLYEYDFDYVPPTFTVDASRTDDSPVTWQYNTISPPSGYLIALRVTDNLGATGIAAESVIVDANQAPDVGLASTSPDLILNNGEQVSFSPGPSTDDPDGIIDLYEYDFSYSGSPAGFIMEYNNNNGAATPPQTFTNPGPNPINVTVAIRVTDDGCPDLQSIASVTYQVLAPVVIGEPLPYTETFEPPSITPIPLNWVVVGKYGQSYYLSTSGSQCSERHMALGRNRK